MEENLVLNEHGNAVLKRFGVNTYGMPIFRMVWADSRFWYLGGEWRPKYANNKGCWIVEKLCPPEQYGSKEEWYRNDLGPFPDHGDYEFVMAFLDDGVWFNASEHQLQFLCRAVEETAARSTARIWSDLKLEQEMKERASKQQIRDIVSDAAPAVGHVDKRDARILVPQFNPMTGSYLL